MEEKKSPLIDSKEPVFSYFAGWMIGKKMISSAQIDNLRTLVACQREGHTVVQLEKTATQLHMIDPAKIVEEVAYFIGGEKVIVQGTTSNHILALSEKNEQEIRRRVENQVNETRLQRNLAFQALSPTMSEFLKCVVRNANSFPGIILLSILAIVLGILTTQRIQNVFDYIILCLFTLITIMVSCSVTNLIGKAEKDVQARYIWIFFVIGNACMVCGFWATFTQIVGTTLLSVSISAICCI